MASLGHSSSTVTAHAVRDHREPSRPAPLGKRHQKCPCCSAPGCLSPLSRPQCYSPRLSLSQFTSSNALRGSPSVVLWRFPLALSPRCPLSGGSGVPRSHCQGCSSPGAIGVPLVNCSQGVPRPLPPWVPGAGTVAMLARGAAPPPGSVRGPAASLSLKGTDGRRGRCRGGPRPARPLPCS